MGNCTDCGESIREGTDKVKCLLGMFKKAKTLKQAQVFSCEEYCFSTTYEKPEAAEILAAA